MAGVRRIWPPAGRQRRAVGIAAAALVLLVAGVLVALAATGGEEERPSVGSTVEVARVPQVVGLRAPQARARLERAGLASAVERKASARPAGVVIAAKPKAGSRVERGVAILLVVSGGRPARPATTTAETETRPAETETEPAETETETAPTVTEPAETETEPAATDPTDTVIVQPEPRLSEVPGVTEVGFVDSARMIEDRGYVAETVAVKSGRPRGLVLRQEPAPGTPLARGRTVRLYVALGRGGRGAVELGDFTGLPERQARELLMRAGLMVRTVDRGAPGRKLVGVVLQQRPAAPRKLPVLSQVTLFVGR